MNIPTTPVAAPEGWLFCLSVCTQMRLHFSTGSVTSYVLNYADGRGRTLGYISIA